MERIILSGTDAKRAGTEEILRHELPPDIRPRTLYIHSIVD